ncbi:hypothetical protein LOZ52_002857 [Ophidiomyces ophidiicola]|nr:hypothetical protein LOZ64_004599 [Ophidiomyces ophidiicola]KAI2004683.1 hypothetical protein LOZ49_005751 [Ophidiomyces ophidiicola]KAI2018680.1 hypothetical protein LOZ46_003727 [Ophidiomyces ophidiicola]KAI2133353.1 hypothetical protein LOZ29_004736 [Ophidiomyces ophidiicola]KAI2146917.1 hypothetical protein LOZ28_000423 [Ophidiomyces ophidiicola]
MAPHTPLLSILTVLLVATKHASSQIAGCKDVSCPVGHFNSMHECNIGNTSLSNVGVATVHSKLNPKAIFTWTFGIEWISIPLKGNFFSFNRNYLFSSPSSLDLTDEKLPFDGCALLFEGVATFLRFSNSDEKTWTCPSLLGDQCLNDLLSQAVTELKATHGNQTKSTCEALGNKMQHRHAPSSCAQVYKGQWGRVTAKALTGPSNLSRVPKGECYPTTEKNNNITIFEKTEVRVAVDYVSLRRAIHGVTPIMTLFWHKYGSASYPEQQHQASKKWIEEILKHDGPTAHVNLRRGGSGRKGNNRNSALDKAVTDVTTGFGDLSIGPGAARDPADRIPSPTKDNKEPQAYDAEFYPRMGKAEQVWLDRVIKERQPDLVSRRYQEMYEQDTMTQNIKYSTEGFKSVMGHDTITVETRVLGSKTQTIKTLKVFENGYSKDQGTIIAIRNIKENEGRKGEGMSWSEVTWQQWSEVAGANRGNLQRIMRDTVTNRNTKKAMEQVYKDMGWEYTHGVDKKITPHGSEQMQKSFDTLSGTANGRGVFQLLGENRGALGDARVLEWHILPSGPHLMAIVGKDKT